MLFANYKAIFMNLVILVGVAEKSLNPFIESVLFRCTDR